VTDGSPYHSRYVEQRHSIVFGFVLFLRFAVGAPL
jgi:hypothetical protein